jgi:hypothetical protein
MDEISYIKTRVAVKAGLRYNLKIEKDVNEKNGRWILNACN